MIINPFTMQVVFARLHFTKSVVLAVAAFILLISTGCSMYGPREVWGQDVPVDLIVYFTLDATNEKIGQFWENVIGMPDPKGGSRLLLGISGAMSAKPVEGHEAIAIDFKPTATRQDREEALLRIKSSPIVYKILKDVAPSSVTSLK